MELRVAENDKRALAADWVERANERLLEAESLMKRGYARGAVPSAYFAIYAAMRALLRLKGVNVENPRRAFSAFDTHFVKPRLFSFTLMGEAETVEKIRELADYYETAPIPKAQARYAVNAAAEFVAGVEEFIKADKEIKVKADRKKKQ